MAIGRLQRAGEHSFLHRGIDQAQIDQIGVNWVISLPGLRQVFKRGPKPVDRTRPVVDSPLVSSGEKLASQALVINRVRVPHRDREIAQHPAHCPECQEIARRIGHPLAFNESLRHRQFHSRARIWAIKQGTVGSRFQQDSFGNPRPGFDNRKEAGPRVRRQSRGSLSGQVATGIRSTRSVAIRRRSRARRDARGSRRHTRLLAPARR